MKRTLLAAVLTLGAMTAAQATTEAPKATGAPAVTPVPSKADRMARGQQLAGAVCVACHGLDGMSSIPANPNIAGMPEQYIAKQLELFKTGARKNAVMQGMAANLSPDDMRALGIYYFAQTAKPNAVARDAALAAKGQKIYRSGIAELKIPACAGCHGGAGAGIPAAYPRLAGQWPDYTFQALRAYANGSRKNAQMNAITARMRDTDMQAVAEYIAGMRSK
jgi:cytochrome c553